MIVADHDEAGEGDDASACPCCSVAGVFALPRGSYEICPICGWQDDPIQAVDPAYEAGANGVSLAQARANFRVFGAIDPSI